MIQPLNNPILIKPTDVEERFKKAGLVMPERAKDKELQAQNEGPVVAVGPGLLLPTGERSALGVQVGDVVMYEPSGPHGKLFKDGADGEYYFICTEEAILGVRG